MGFDVSEELAFGLVTELLDHAVRINNFVRVDMEGSPYTQRTFDFVRQLHRLPGRAAASVPSSSRTCTAAKGRERPAGGAHSHPAVQGRIQGAAGDRVPKKADVDANYLKLARALMKSGVYHGIATHDERIIGEIKRFYAAEENIPASAYEFQMLYGVRRDLQQQLVREGYGLRVYIPFWDGVVSVLHAAAGRTSGERILYCTADAEEVGKDALRYSHSHFDEWVGLFWRRANSERQ